MKPPDGMTPSGSHVGVYDFHTVSLLDKTSVEHHFTLHNNGKTVFVIARLQSSCGCLSTLLGPARAPASKNSSSASSSGKRATLLPGQEVTVRVTVNLASLAPGPVEKTVSVYANKGTLPSAELRIVGTLSADVSLDPPVVDFGRVEVGTSVTRRIAVRVEPRLVALGVVPRLVVSNPAVHIVQRTEQEGTGKENLPNHAHNYIFEATLDKSAAVGPLSGSVELHPPTTLPAGAVGARLLAALSRVNGLIVGQVFGDMTADPPLLSFGIVPEGTAAVRQIVLTGKTDAVTKKMHVESSAALLTTSLLPARAGAPVSATGGGPAPFTQVVEVKLSAHTPVGIFQSLVKVTLENGQQVIVPVQAYVRASKR